MAKRLLVVDVFPLVFRSHFGFSRNPLIGRDGHEVSALFGYARNVVAAISELKPTHVVAAIDSPGKTWRHDLFPAYKVGRPDTPETLRHQLGQLRDLTESMGLACVEAPGYEADDIVGSMVRTWVNHPLNHPSHQMTDEAAHAYVLSTDKDLFQLASDQVSILRPPFPYKLITPASVGDKWGIQPSQVSVSTDTYLSLNSTQPFQLA